MLYIYCIWKGLLPRNQHKVAHPDSHCTDIHAELFLLEVGQGSQKAHMRSEQMRALMVLVWQSLSWTLDQHYLHQPRSMVHLRMEGCLYLWRWIDQECNSLKLSDYLLHIRNPKDFQSLALPNHRLVTQLLRDSSYLYCLFSLCQNSDRSRLHTLSLLQQGQHFLMPSLLLQE